MFATCDFPSRGGYRREGARARTPKDARHVRAANSTQAARRKRLLAESLRGLHPLLLERLDLRFNLLDLLLHVTEFHVIGRIDLGHGLMDAFYLAMQRVHLALSRRHRLTKRADLATRELRRRACRLLARRR